MSWRGVALGLALAVALLAIALFVESNREPPFPTAPRSAPLVAAGEEPGFHAPEKWSEGTPAPSTPPRVREASAGSRAPQRGATPPSPPSPEPTATSSAAPEQAAAEPRRSGPPSDALTPTSIAEPVSGLSGPRLPLVSLRGTASFFGKAPERKPLKREADPVCAKTPAFDDRLLVSPRGGSLALGGIANVVILVTAGDERDRDLAPRTPVVIEQRGCLYEPRISVAREGQRIEILNSDETLHHVHAWQGKETVFNRAMPSSRVPPIESRAGPAGSVLRLQCDVHPWMKGLIFVAPGPHFAITAGDGSFVIEGLAPGRYLLEAWHETLAPKQQWVTVGATGGAADFTFQGR